MSIAIAVSASQVPAQTRRALSLIQLRSPQLASPATTPRESSHTMSALSCRSKQTGLSGNADDQSRDHGTGAELLDAAERCAEKQQASKG
jgi:hypothetical protein